MKKGLGLHRAEMTISLVLRWGLWLSATVIAVGMVTSWVTPNARGFSTQDLARLTQSQGGEAPGVPHHLNEWAAGLAAFDAGTVIALGIVLLIALPVVRVALSAVLFLMCPTLLIFKKSKLSRSRSLVPVENLC